ncbi:MAG: TolB family protein, partial [Endomicrobiales bacterium]
RIAYLSDEAGARGICVMALASRKAAVLWRVDRSLVPGPENVHTEGNALAFSPDGNFLAFGGERQQKDYLYVYDLSTGRIREIDARTDTVSSPVFSPDGETVYFSGMRGGFRDLYAFALKGGKCAPLTAGPMDELDAAPSPDGRFLVFSAERAGPSGRVEYDLCRLELAGGRREFLTALAGDERSPCFSEEGTKIYFTSDRDGVRDIYVLEAASGNIERLTRVIGGNFQPRVRKGQLLFSSFRKTGRHLYLAQLEKLPRETLAPAAPVLPEETAGKDGGEALRHAGGTGPVFSDFSGTAASARPYRFRASTDLFFPALFYSTLDGLSFAG